MLYKRPDFPVLYNFPLGNYRLKKGKKKTAGKTAKKEFLMKKQILFVMLTALLACSVVFLSCSEDEEMWAKASKPGKPTVKQYDRSILGDSRGPVRITWDAAKGAGSYRVYMQIEGKKTMFDLGRGDTVEYLYDSYGVIISSIPSANYDIDKFECFFNPYGTATVDYKARFGVSAAPIQYRYNSLDSDIAWSDLFNVKAAP